MSDQATNGNGSKPKRIQRPLSKEQWKLARHCFESGPDEVNHSAVAFQFNTSVSSVHKRAAAERWSKASNLVTQARKGLEKATERHLAVATEKAGAIVANSLLDDLQPIIEREKRAQIQRAIKRSKRAQRRIDKIAGGFQVYDAKKGELVDCEVGPKDEMHLATAEDKYDNIIRRNLGMSDGATQTGVFNLGILTNHAAVQFVSPPVPNNSP